MPVITLPVIGVDAPGVVDAPLDEHQVLVFIVQVTLLVAVARLLGALMKRLNQPPVVGELLAGVVLGPSLFGLVFPTVFEWVFVAEPEVNSASFGLAWLGVVFLLVVMGFETDLGIIARFKKVALAVATGSMLLPMLVTGVVGYFLAGLFSGSVAPAPWIFAVFFGLALSVSALPVVGKILADLGVMRRDFAQVVLAAAMAKDAVGWLVLALISGIAVGGVRFDQIGVSFGGLILFVIAAMTVGRSLLDRLFRFALSRRSSVEAGFSLAVVIGLICGAITQALRVEAILGAYVAGLVLARVRHQLPQVRDRLEMVTTAFFAPIFFALSGLRVDITALADVQIAIWTAVAIVLAVVSKIVGTIVSGRIVGVGTNESLALGAGLSPLGVMGVVVAIIGLNVGVINEAGYTVLLLAAITTSLAAPSLLRWAMGRFELPPEEAERLERESLKEGSEILGVGRVLLPTRGGDNSIYAARIAASVFADAELTVLAIDRPEEGGRRKARSGVSADPSAVISALDGRSTQIIRSVADDPSDAIVAESRLGYDVLVMGASGRAERSLESSVVERVLREVQIQTVIVRVPDGEEIPDRLPRKVLVPVTASRTSRAAEELGFTLAHVAGGEAVALHVVNRPDGEGMFLEGGRVDDAMRTAETLVEESRAFGTRLGAEVSTEIRVAPNAEQEILDFASGQDFDVVVLGTASRPLTDRPFFGHRISYMIENSGLPCLIVAMPSFRN
ncbi:MAG TPA: cation:proton antiporter [Acidimicrobiia bacterium]|jgi:Kef-type K+ transport system membrane component KefB|nr:cation:proton antiporter [Acidimicrobiia bacterium]